MAEEDPALRDKRFARLGLAVALVLLAFAIWRSLFLIDDSFISFRYARNWVEGHGLVYNPGVELPVEGYSNFSWVAILALGLFAGVPLEVFANVVSVSAAVLTLLLVFRCLRRKLELDGIVASLATIALALLPGFHYWASGGLETALFGLLLFVCWEGLCAPSVAEGQARPSTLHDVGVGLCAGLLVLTRPEGVAWVAGLFLCAFIARGKQSARSVGRVLGVSALIAIPHLFWRHSFYGDWLPNTVYAKSAMSSETIARGARCVSTWALASLWPLCALVAPLAVPKGPQRRLALAILTMLAGGLAYNLLVGGDWMPFFRFLAPLSGFFALGFALFLAKLPQRAATSLGLALAAYACLPAFNVEPLPRGLREALYFRQFKVGYQTEHERWATGNRNRELNTWLGHAIAQSLPRDSVWTGGAIGAIGYYSRVQILGRNGLVHRGVARREVESAGQTAGHEKRVPMAYFRGESPTFYFAQIFTAAVPPVGPGFDYAVNMLKQQVFSDPEEAALLECTYVEAKPLHRIPGLAEPATLMLLLHTDDPQKAREFWANH